MLVTSGPILANGSFIAIPESSDCAKDAGSAANSPHDTPSVTPTKHIQHKVASLGHLPTKTLRGPATDTGSAHAADVGLPDGLLLQRA